MPCQCQFSQQSTLTLHRCNHRSAKFIKKHCESHQKTILRFYGSRSIQPANIYLFLCCHSGWVSEQPVTESSVEWHLDEELWTAASSYTTPDLAILLSEIIQLDDWQPGSSISFLVKPHDLEAMMTLAVATQSTISHGQESSQLRYAGAFLPWALA
eukprot:SAG11_NODE_516_length_8817_cov_2.360977_8_plen_156_part_00